MGHSQERLLRRHRPPDDGVDIPTGDDRDVTTRRVLCLTNMYPTSERPVAGVFVERQVAALRALGHDVDVHVIEGWRTKRAYLDALLRVGHIARRGYDVVHAHYGLTGLSAFLARPPLVVTLHGSDALVGHVQPALSRVACIRAAAIIAVSRPIAERFARVRRVSFSRVPVHVVPCGVDLDRFRPVPRAVARAHLGLDASRQYVLFPFDPSRRVKRHDIARAVVSDARSRGADVELLVASGVPHAEMPFYLSAADAMLLCSDSEGSPTSVKEALACNTPVVSLAVGGVGDILGGIEGCAVVDRRTPEATVEALAAALVETLARETPFEGRTFAMPYDEAATARRITEVYDTVLGRAS